MLTAADVEQKTFSTALRGYDLDEVDDFLDEVVATIRDLNEQLEAAQREAKTPVAPPAAIPEPEVEAKDEARDEAAVDESAIARALIAAQTAADQLLEEAQSQANKIVGAAKDEAENLEAEKRAKRLEAEGEMRRYSERVAAVRSELAVLADEVSVKLDDMDSVIEGRHVGTETAVSGPADNDDADLQSALDIDDDSDDVADTAERDEHAGGVDPSDGGEGWVTADGDDGEDDGAEDDDSDQLGDILNGLASDLQLDSDDEDDSSSSADDDN